MLSRIILLLACSVSVVSAAEPLFNPVPLAEAPRAAGDLLEKETAAGRAMAAGMPSVAAAIYEQLLAAEPESALFDRRVLALVTARLEAGRVEQAAQDLTRLKGPAGAAARLRAGLIAAQRGNLTAARTESAAIKLDELSVWDRPWAYFLQGLVLEQEKEILKAEQAYDQAAVAAVDDWQRASFALARERVRLASGEVTESQANALRQNAERFQGRVVGYDFGRQYAVALHRLGRRDEAIGYLQRQLLALAPTDRAVRDEYRLLLGVLAGPGDPIGRTALEALLTESEDRGRLRAALRLLTEGSRTGAARGNFLTLAGRLIERTDPPHPILENLLLVRGEFALAAGQFEAADQDAKDLLARFPGSELKPLALSQLAQSAWSLRRYRTAADYAVRAQAEARDPQLRARLGVVVAEAYYRAGDYRGAAGAYAAAAETVPAGVEPGAILFQQIMSELQAERLSEAAELLTQLAGDPRFDALSRWQAEWNLARAFQGAGRTAEAFRRVTALRGQSDAATLPAGLRARMAWLQARLALEAGEPARALELADGLPGSLAGVDDRLRAEIISLSRLLSAEAKFRLDRPDEAVADLKALREGEGAGAADIGAKMRSFIVEADHYAGVGRVVEAQALLTRMADEYPENEYADDALYKAALNAERRGKDEYFEQAYLLLERLVRDYPKSDLVFHARLRQGDLLRRLNDFPRAQLIYESLINTSGGHEGVLAAQLALGACHRAQVAADPSHFESAVTIFERLRDLPSAPVGLRLEAGFQLGDMYLQAGGGRRPDPGRAKAVWGPLVSAYLLAPDAVPLEGPRGRYWMARMLVRLSDLAESEGRREESLEICRLILEKGLPGAGLARSRLATRGAPAGE
ncbi:MAG: hypothetical protein ABII82_13675 [Verrucomicrobiota bacterium]